MLFCFVRVFEENQVASYGNVLYRITRVLYLIQKSKAFILRYSAYHWVDLVVSNSVAYRF